MRAVMKLRALAPTPAAPPARDFDLLATAVLLLDAGASARSFMTARMRPRRQKAENQRIAVISLRSASTLRSCSCMDCRNRPIR